jgi:hypothetical protein
VSASSPLATSSSISSLLLGDEMEEKVARGELAALVGLLCPLVHTVAEAEARWQKGTTPVVTRREGRETAREWLRLVIRAWREQADGRRAGAAHWQSRWQQGHVGALAQAERVAEVEWRVGAYPSLVLEYSSTC